MIRVFSGGRYTAKNWTDLSEVLSNGLQSVCCNDCDNCKYNHICREVSQAVTFCDTQANRLLAKRGDL